MRFFLKVQFLETVKATKVIIFIRFFTNETMTIDKYYSTIKSPNWFLSLLALQETGTLHTMLGYSDLIADIITKSTFQLRLLILD